VLEIAITFGLAGLVSATWITAHPAPLRPQPGGAKLGIFEGHEDVGARLIEQPRRER